ncbi:MAG: alpha-1,2-fucosyltransferase [Lachnospiraceae bacterium]|nr:alpha-1,2-fucosyltransferase [Lachnospiraceae bacterium]
MIIRLSGGLGNQMFQYAMGRAVSEAKGEKLYIDTYGFKRDPQREYALGNYPIKAEILKGIKNLWYIILFYGNRKLHFAKPGKKKAGIYIENGFFQYEELVNNKARFYEGCWQNIRYFERIKCDLAEELDGGKQLGESCRSLHQRILETTSVAVHVRRGDYLTYNNQTIYAMPSQDYYRKAMAYIRTNTKNPVFYFFSDDMEWCKKEFALEDSCVISSDLEKSSQEDLYLMQSCKHHIIANSSFSWWAAYLGKKEESIQIAPEKWYVEEKVNEMVKEAILNGFKLIGCDE